MSSTMTTMSPPSYYPGQSPSESLPAYSRRNTLRPSAPRRERTEHSFCLTEGRHAWANLRMRSSAKSSKNLPTFYEKEDINAFLEIDADKADSIHSVSAVVTGRVASGSGADNLQFLNIVVPIWSRSPDQPRLPSPSEGASGSKLRGQCSWELSISLPAEVLISGRMARLPETLNDRDVAVTVQYEVAIKIGRGKLRSDSRLSTLFGYVPSSRPEPPSPLRQLAYQENSILPGPLVDPQGWFASRPTVLRGPLFKSKNVDAKLTFFLAKPLSYTRGSVIPCSVILESSQSQLLDLLCAPEAIPLCLQRNVQYTCKAAPTQVQAFANGTGQNHQTTNIGSAVWWRSPSQPGTPYARHMEGEIRLPKDLNPSSSVGHFNLSYNVILGSLNIPGFSTASSESNFCQRVEITTKYAHGPRPQAYSPPGYVNDCKPARRGSPESIEPVPYGISVFQLHH